MNSICHKCSTCFKEQPFLEDSKQEDTECHYCSLRKILKPAETLYKGFPSCFACKKIDKELNKPPGAIMKSSHKHNKTSIGFS